MAPVTVPLEPDPEQAPVLDHARGTMLVIGPPGSGKTALLRERFARLVEGGVAPERVMLLTLNRRAARDARDWLLPRLGRSIADLPVFTAHGYAFRLLGRRFRDVGYDQPPRVLSAPEQYAAVREQLRRERPEDWPRFGRLLGVAGFARQVADFLLRAQERLLAPAQVEELAERAGRREYLEVGAYFRRYLQTLTAGGECDFAGLLAQAVTLLERGISEEERFEHVLVDDYQDATPAAEGIVRALARVAQSVVVAADPDGHVFSYRGGTLEPLRRMEETLGVAAEVRLSRSHRLGEALAALAGLKEEEGSPPPRPGPGVDARVFLHPGEEVEAVARDLLRARVDQDVPWERMAVILRRYGEYLPALRHALARHGVPFVVVAEASAVASEPANRPVVELLRYVFQPERRDDLLESILASPVGGLDPHQLRGLRREALRRGLSLRRLMESDLRPPDGLREPIERFRRVVNELPGRAREPDAAFFWLWTELPWFRDLVAADDRDRDLDALAALGDVLSRFVERRPGAGVLDYLETLDAAEFGPDPWVLPEERRPHAVRVVSAHRAQGLEFEVTMVVGCLEGEFPVLEHRAPVVDIERVVSPESTAASRGRERLAEERALFRLAVSRARRRTVLFASSSASSRNPRTPSRFAERLGLSWTAPDEATSPAASLRSMEAELRRRLADRSFPGPGRLAAVAVLPEVGSRPTTWWGGRVWTDPGLPLYPEDLRSSYSRLSTLENCGLQYLYQVELGLDPESTHQMWLGGLVHALIERVQKGDLARDEPALLGALSEAWEPDRFPNRAIERQKRRDAESMVRNWLRGEGVPPEQSEVWFEFPIDGAVLRGRIDAIFVMQNGHTRLVDYKTGRSVPTQADADRDLQLAAYYLAMRRDPRLRKLPEPRLLELAYLLESRHREAFKQVRVRPASIEGYEEWAENTIKDLLARVRAERFAPDPEADCFFCSFKPICPLWPEGAEVLT